MEFMISKDVVKKLSKSAAQYKACADEFAKGGSLSDEFKKDFCTYYGMDSYSPYKDEEWRNIYFGVFEEALKDKEISFVKILKSLYEKTGGRVELSSAGKIIASIDLTKPVWDNALIKNLHAVYPDVPAKFNVGSNKEKGIEDAAALYARIEECLAELAKTPEAEDFIRDFDCLLYDCEDFPAEKKIEMYLCNTH